jgi:L-ascorbate metabolism protein UlaG (beta-lactamase superfamily)
MNKKTKFICLTVLTLGIVSLWQLAWFDTDKTWEQATGWESIPVDERQGFYEARPGEPEIHWLGHAGVLIEWEDQRIAFDPNLSSQCKVSRRTFAVPVQASGLGDLDAVLISHAHYDHLDLPTLSHIPKIKQIILPKNSQDFLPENLLSRSDIIDLKVREQVQVGKLTITALPAVHNGSRYHPFHSRYLAFGYIVSNGEYTLYYAGDTAYSPEFSKIAAEYHPNIVLVPIGGFRPEFILHKYHLSPAEAVRAGLDLRAQTFLPIHFGTFRISLEYPETALPLFAKEARARGLAWKMLPLLQQ